MPLLQPTQRPTAPDFMYELTECKRQSKTKAVNPARFLLQMRKQKQGEEVTSSSIVHFSNSSLQPQFRAELPVSVNKYRWEWKMEQCITVTDAVSLPLWVWCSRAFTRKPCIKAWIAQDPDSSLVWTALNTRFWAFGCCQDHWAPTRPGWD